MGTSADNLLLIVSKDGKDWQFVGGKPDKGESIFESAVREVFEESGLDIEPIKEDLEQFGYYIIEENGEIYIQIRLSLKIA